MSTRSGQKQTYQMTPGEVVVRLNPMIEWLQQQGAGGPEIEAEAGAEVKGVRIACLSGWKSTLPPRPWRPCLSVRQWTLHIRPCQASEHWRRSGHGTVSFGFSGASCTMSTTRQK